MGMELKSKEAVAQLVYELSKKVEEWKWRGHQAKIATLLIEGDPASAFYAKSKKKIAVKLGVMFELHPFPNDVSEAALLTAIQALNEDPLIHGIMLELPLPKAISTKRMTSAISPLKDVDGLTPHNKLATLTGEKGLYPATPQACIRLLKHYGYTLQGKNVVLIGRGETVGQPLLQLLIREHATVTLCHSHTVDLAFHIKRADILFTAVGRARFITTEMVHSELIIVDVGMNETEAGRIEGDVAANVLPFIQGMTPTPGGVGALTTMIVFENLLRAMELQHQMKEVEGQ